MIYDYGRIIKPPRSKHCYKINFGMSLLSIKDEQICRFVSCKDRLQDYFKTTYYKEREKDDYHSFFPEKEDPFPCTEKLKLLLLLDTTKHTVREFSGALDNWHVIEDFAGIERTKSELVKYDNTSKIGKEKLVLLTGDKMYTKKLQLLSAMTLFLRFGFFNPTFSIKSIKDLNTSFKEVIHNNKAYEVKDKYHMGAVINLIPSIFKNKDELFEGLVESDLFPLGNPLMFHSRSGIVALCEETSVVKELNTRMCNLKK
jgi:hypothetical protein